MRHAITRESMPARPRAHTVTATLPGSGCGEQSDRRDAGERDLDAHPPVQARHSAPEHRAKQHGVANDRDELHAGGSTEPQRISVVQASPGLVEARELGDKQVQANE